MKSKQAKVGTVCILFGIIFVMAVLLWSSNAGATAPPPNPNQVEYWCPNGGVKYDPADTPFTVPEPPEGFFWTLLVLKAGSEESANPVNEQFPNPVVGQEYSRTDGKDISHAILCYGIATTTTTQATTTTHPTTTLATTTTQATTTTLATTTTEKETTTTGATTTEATTTIGATTTAATTTTEGETTTTGATTTAATTTTGATTTAPTTTGATTTVVNTTQETTAPTTTAAPTTTVAVTTTVQQPAVVAPAVSEATPTTVPTTLPVTGFPTLPVASIGIFMIAFGALLRRFA